MSKNNTSDKRTPSTLKNAFIYAGTGIGTTIKQERNIRIELVFAALALVVSALLKLEPLEWAIIVILIAFVLACELANTALERLTDLVCLEQNLLAKQAKDAMAGAVFIASAGAVVGGGIIFITAALRLLGM